MQNDLTLALKVTADAKEAVGAAKNINDALAGVGQSAQAAQSQAEKLNATQQFQSKWFNQTAQSAREQSVALAETSSSVNKLLDRYDPLSAKLRQLQNDFKALDAAASKGQVTGRDDARLDSVYAKLQQEISATQAAMSAVGSAAQAGFDKVAAGAEKSMFATVGARRELMVLGHEAISGNFSRMPGSMMVLAERTDLSMASLLGLGGVVLTVAAGAGVLAYAMHAGAEEQKEMQRALGLTSDFAGLTRGGLRALADEMSSSSQLTIGQSKEVVTQLAASGKIGAEAFGAVAGLVAVYAKATGQSAEEATPKILKMFADPTKGAEELNHTLHALAPLEMERIATLQRTGHEAEAQIVFAEAYRKELEKHKEPIGALESAWNSTKKAASEAWDAVLGIGREKTLEEKLKEQQVLLKRYSAELAAGVNVPQAREGANKAQAAIDGFGSEKAVADGIAAANAILARKNARDQDTLSIAHANSELYRMQTIQEKIDKLQSDRAKRATENNAQEEKFRLDSIARLQQQLTEQPKDTTAYSNAVAARIKSEADLAYTLQDAAGKSQLALLDMQFKARVLAETDYLAQKQAIEQTGADAAIKRITDQMAAEKDAYDKSGKPEDRERHLATLNKLIGELGVAAQKSANVGLSEFYRLLGETRKAEDELSKSQDKIQASGEDFITQMNQKSDLLDADTALLNTYSDSTGKAALAVKILNDQHKIDIELQTKLKGLTNPEEADRMSAAAEAAKQKIATYESAKYASNEWKKASGEIERSLTDGLMRSFEHGKSVASAFKDTLLNMFKTLILRPVISFIVSPISGAISAAMSGVGFSGAAQAGTSAGGVGSWLNAGSTIKSGYNMATGGGNGWLSNNWGGNVTESWMGSKLGFSTEHMVDGVGTGQYLSTAQGDLAANAMNTGGQILGYANAFMAARDGQWGKALGTAVGTYFGGPIGSFVGSTVGGWVDGIFGGGGGPKTEYYGGSSFDGIRDTTHSAEIDAAINASVAGYASTVAKLGGTASSVKLRIGGDSDPAGTAQDSMGYQMSLNGGAMLQDVRNFDRGQGQAAIPEMINRALLDAFQHTDMGPVTNALVAGIDPATVTKAVLDQTLQAISSLTKESVTNVEKIFGEAFDASKFAALSTSGENLLTTFERLTSEFQITNTVAEALGKDTSTAFGAIGLASTSARESLIAMMGGVTQMSTTMQNYYTNFFSDNERHANDLKALGAQFSALGFIMPETRAGFRALVEAQGVSTESGRAMTAALLGLNGAFAAVVPAVDSTATSVANLAAAALDAANKSATDAMSGVTRAVSAEKDRMTAAYNAQVEQFNAQLNTVSASVGKLQTLASSLKGTLNGMQIAGSDAAYRQAAQAQISAALATARSGGGLPLDGQLDSALQAISKPSEQLFSSFADYSRDFYKTANDIAALNDLTGEQLSADEKMQSLLKDQLRMLSDNHNADMTRLDAIVSTAQAQLDAANGINTSVLSVAAALAAFNTSISALAAASGAKNSSTAAYQPYSVEDTPAQRTAKVEAQTGVAFSASDDPLTAAAKMLYQSTHGGASSAEYNAAAAAVGGDIGAALGWKGSMEDTERLRTLYGFAVGTNYVPNDMTANIHEGERIIPAADNRELMSRLRNPQANNDALLAEIKLLRAEVQGLRAVGEATAGHTAKTSRLLDRAMPGGDAIATRAAV